MASNFPVNINLADFQELKTLPGISNGRARVIIGTRKRLGGSMTVDDFKSITKIGYTVWQPLLETGAITFGPAGLSGPANAARTNYQASSTSESSPDVLLNQDASSPEHSISPPAQSTPVQMAPAHLQFPPKGAIALTPIPEAVPFTPGIHPGLGGPNPATVPQQVPAPPAHPDVESGRLPVVAAPDMVSHDVQFAEGPSSPPIRLAEELALMKEALQAAEEALAAEREQSQAATEALAIERRQFQHTRQAYEELQVAQAALVEEQKQLNSVKQAFQGELETAREQLRSTNYSYQDKLASLGQPCGQNEQNAQVMQQKRDEYKRELEKARKAMSSLEGTNKSHWETIEACQKQLEEADNAALKAKEDARAVKIALIRAQAAAKVVRPVPAPHKSPLKFQFVKCEVKPEGLAASPEVTGSSAPTPKPCSSRGYKGPTSVTSGPSFHVQGVGELPPSLGACAQPLAMKPIGTQTQPEYKLPTNHNVQLRGSAVAKYHGRVVPSEVPDHNGGLVTPRDRSDRHVTSGSKVRPIRVMNVTPRSGPHMSISEPRPGHKPQALEPRPPRKPHQWDPYPPPEETPPGDTIERNLLTISYCAPNNTYEQSMPRSNCKPSNLQPPPVPWVAHPNSQGQLPILMNLNNGPSPGCHTKGCYPLNLILSHLGLHPRVDIQLTMPLLVHHTQPSTTERCMRSHPQTPVN